MRYTVENMTCGHCERTIRAAVAALDSTARVDVDLRGGTVDIDDAVDPARVVAALAEEGYPATPSAG